MRKIGVFSSDKTRVRSNVFDMAVDLERYEEIKQRERDEDGFRIVEENQNWTQEGDLMIFMTWHEPVG